MKAKLLTWFKVVLGLMGTAIFASSLPAQENQPWESIILFSGEVAHIGDPTTIHQEGGNSEERRQANVAIILDASGSMNAQLPGTGKSKLAIAKEILSEVILKIPEEIQCALWIYGHRYPQKPKENHAAT